MRRLALPFIAFFVIQSLVLHFQYLNDDVDEVMYREVADEIYVQHDPKIASTEQSTKKAVDDNDNAFLTMYGAHRVQPSMQNLPMWLQNYFSWHREQTETDNSTSNATKYMVVTCLDYDKCGGFSDRLRALPFFLLAGNVTQRAICIHWTKPYGLEEFFEPPPGGIDWRCPDVVGDSLDRGKKSQYQSIPYREFGNDRGFTSMVHSAENTFQQLKELDGERFVLVRLKDQDFNRINELNSIFQAHSYREEMPLLSAWQHVELMGDIFRVMFQPVEQVSRRVNETMSTLGLKENDFTSMHIRARYPDPRLKRFAANKTTYERHDSHGGLEFEGRIKDFIVGIAENAITCAKRLGEKNGVKKIYMASDSNDLMNYAVSTGLKVHVEEGLESNNDNIVMPLALKRTGKNLHMEGENKTASASDFSPIIEDLLVMGAGKCVAHGIGSFGAFAAGISGNRCRDIHRAWHGKSETCPNGRANRVNVTIKEGDLLFGGRPGGEGKLEYGEDIIL